MKPKIDRTEERFWAKVDKFSPKPDRRPDLGPCWFWTAYRDLNGYGRFSKRRGNMSMAHRVSYELVVGGIPIGLELDHLCVVRHCVNPGHLEPVEHAENSRRSSLGEVTRARLAAQTHCLNGHEFDEANTHIQRSGARRCRPCSAARARARRARLKAAA